MMWSRAVALTVAGAFFLEVFDATVIVTAAPVMATELGVTADAVGIAITAYLCSVAALIPMSGWLAARFGGRRVFLFAVVLFAVASLACAASTSLWMLGSARVLQGVAGALMVPIGQLIVLASTPKPDLVRAIAYLTWPALVAPVIAPFVGGLITDLWGWHWIFLMNLPITAVLFFAGLRYLPREPIVGPDRLDKTGLAIAITGIVALVLGLQWLVDPTRWPIAAVLLPVAAGAVVWTVVRGRRVPGAILDFRAYRFPTYRLVNSAGTLYRACVLAAPFLIPLLYQAGFGWSAVQAGAVLLWLFVGNIAIKPFTTPILRAIGFRWMIGLSTAVVATSFVAFALLPEATPIVLTCLVMLVSGIARSIGFTGYLTIQFADVPQELMTGANTVASTFTQLAHGLGIAFAAASVAVIQFVSASGPEAAVRWSFVVLALVLLVSLVGVLRLPRDAGAHLRVPR
ncbi:MAG TPA: MFS transporter [Microbacteriaceae bacterium]|nr:MFS transporter [Microbacteriaceae bacterium]